MPEKVERLETIETKSGTEIETPAKESWLTANAKNLGILATVIIGTLAGQFSADVGPGSPVNVSIKSNPIEKEPGVVLVKAGDVFELTAVTDGATTSMFGPAEGARVYQSPDNPALVHALVSNKPGQFTLYGSNGKRSNSAQITVKLDDSPSAPIPDTTIQQRATE